MIYGDVCSGIGERPKALDVFCGAGGASMGLHRAGFDVTGVDIKPQPRYPFAFVQGDALAPPVDLSGFDLIWASPPCQAFTDGATARMAKGKTYPNHIPHVRNMIAGHSMTVIENVIKAPVRPDLVLHGHMFPGLKVIRRRKFELSFGSLMLVPPLPKGLLRQGYMTVTGNGTPTGVRKMGLPTVGADDWREAMGIDWMVKSELREAIPPAYSEFIGKRALLHLGERIRAFEACEGASGVRSAGR